MLLVEWDGPVKYGLVTPMLPNHLYAISNERLIAPVGDNR